MNPDLFVGIVLFVFLMGLSVGYIIRGIQDWGLHGH